MEEGIAFLLSGAQPEELNTYSPGALAYLGDSVYELMVRTRLLAQGNRPADKLQQEGVTFSRAAAQAKAAQYLMERRLLSEEEELIYKRGRNTHTHTHARNAAHGDYQKATGLETLFGFLYLSGRDERLKELFALVCEVLEA